MILVDTSIWIDFLRGRPHVFKLAELIEQQEVAALGCILGELAQGARTLQEVQILEGYWANLPRLPEDNIWFEAGLLSFEHKYYAKGIGLIDLAILCAARKNNCQIWTLDKKLQTLLERHEAF